MYGVFAVSYRKDVVFFDKFCQIEFCGVPYRGDKPVLEELHVARDFIDVVGVIASGCEAYSACDEEKCHCFFREMFLFH